MQLIQVRHHLSEATHYTRLTKKIRLSLNDRNLPTPNPTPPIKTKMAITPTTLSTALITAGLPLPSPHVLQTLLSNPSTTRTQPPLPALLATAKHRLLTGNISSIPQILAPSTPAFPPNITTPQIPEQKLVSKIPVQVLSIEDLSKSRWEQVEAIEAKERGEMMKGREIIRVVDVEDENDNENRATRGQRAGAEAMTNVSGGPHRLVLQDVKGQTVYGLELKPVQGIGMNMNIGTKLVLNGVTVARGVVLLEPGTVLVLGGRIDALHKAWMENRKKDLLAAIEGGT
jgi:RecQ-mediated genome instability protein 1